MCISALYLVSQCNALCDSVQCTACPSAIHCMSQCSALCPCAVHFVSQCNVYLLTAVLSLVCAQKWNILVSPGRVVLFGEFSVQRAVTHSLRTPVIVTMPAPTLTSDLYIHFRVSSGRSHLSSCLGFKAHQLSYRLEWFQEVGFERMLRLPWWRLPRVRAQTSLKGR